MDAKQEWCLQCGAGVPGSLVTRSPSWRSTTTVIIATAVLVLGAATAAYAALTKPDNGSRQLTATITKVPAAATPAPTTPTTPATGATTPPPASSTPTPAPATPAVPTAKPPKIPLTVATPKATPAPKVPAPAAIPLVIPKAAPKASPPSGGTTKTEPTPILLDTNAVTTYNPSGYPEDTFGDPSLTIDGDTATDWTARVDPAIAPKMAAGLLVDLKTAQKLAALLLVTSTPGMTIQIFGANGTAAPATVADPGWTKLTILPETQTKRHTRIKLSEAATAFRFVLFWITGVPATSVGTAEAPGRVSVNELELVPTK
jgi:hypothetical protein